MLAYLIEMAYLEAGDIIRSDQPPRVVPRSAIEDQKAA